MNYNRVVPKQKGSLASQNQYEEPSKSLDSPDILLLHNLNYHTIQGEDNIIKY
jgi:hypothetical protein